MKTKNQEKNKKINKNWANIFYTKPLINIPIYSGANEIS